MSNIIIGLTLVLYVCMCMGCMCSDCLGEWASIRI